MKWNLKILFGYYEIKEWHHLEVKLEGMEWNHYLHEQLDCSMWYLKIVVQLVVVEENYTL